MTIETERRNRIRVSLFAYAYEFMNISLVPDSEYDALCRKIDPAIDTGDPIMDAFFRTEFSPDTGMWVHHHPRLEGIKRIYNSLVGDGQKSTASHDNIPIEPGPKMNGHDLTGCNSHLMNMIWLASLGFSVVPNGIVEFVEGGIVVRETGQFINFGQIFPSR